MSDISIINPYIRVAMQSVLEAKTEVARRIIFDYELIYIADGEFILNYNNNNYTCSKGQFILLRPGISHSFSGIKRTLSQPHIHFDITHMPDSPGVPVCFRDLPDLTENERKNIRNDIFSQYPQNPLVTFSDSDAALQLFEKIVASPQPSPLTQKGLLIELIDMLISENFPATFESAEKLRYSIEEQVKDYLDAGQGMASSLDNIALQFNYSKFYLQKLFKKRYGISIISYRNAGRMQAARRLLQTKSVSDVSEQLGFSSIYVFSRAFKNYFGISPGHLKKNNR